MSSRSSRAGLYAFDDTRYALNRPLSEDSPITVSDDVVAGLFAGLDFTRLDDAAGSTASLASEVWRLFLVIMIVALMAEAVLCLPERRNVKAAVEPLSSDPRFVFGGPAVSRPESVQSSP